MWGSTDQVAARERTAPADESPPELSQPAGGAGPGAAWRVPRSVASSGRRHGSNSGVRRSSGSVAALRECAAPGHCSRPARGGAPGWFPAARRWSVSRLDLAARCFGPSRGGGQVGRPRVSASAARGVQSPDRVGHGGREDAVADGAQDVRADRVQPGPDRRRRPRDSTRLAGARKPSA